MATKVKAVPPRIPLPFILPPTVVVNAQKFYRKKKLRCFITFYLCGPLRKSATPKDPQLIALPLGGRLEAFRVKYGWRYAVWCAHFELTTYVSLGIRRLPWKCNATNFTIYFEYHYHILSCVNGSVKVTSNCQSLKARSRLWLLSVELCLNSVEQNAKRSISRKHFTIKTFKFLRRPSRWLTSNEVLTILLALGPDLTVYADDVVMKWLIFDYLIPVALWLEFLLRQQTWHKNANVKSYCYLLYRRKTDVK